MQTLIFAILSVAGVIGWFRSARTHKPHVSTLKRRSEQLIGQKAALATVVNGRGGAKVGDTVWTVTGPDFPADATVVVKRIDGSVLEVSAA